MPSDARIQPSLEALQRPISAYRSVAVSARERVRAMLATGTGAERARMELGAFGGARIDTARFAELERGAALDAQSRERLRHAAVVLDEILAAGDEAFVVEVAAGDTLSIEVARALAHLGRAFGAAHVIELVRSRRYDPERHDRFLKHYLFEWWNKAERAHAPPLVVTVAGTELRPGALAEFLDGGVRLVLLVSGATSPAPLARLVTPSTLVIQTGEPSALDRLAAYDGPGVAALLGQEGALFVHDPRGGTALWQRLTINRRPLAEPKKTLGGVSIRQQHDELAQLDALAAQPKLPETPVEAVAGAGPGDPADRLTAWLLAQSGLTNAS